MKKKFLCILLSTTLLLTGCGSTTTNDTSDTSSSTTNSSDNYNDNTASVPYTINNSFDYVRDGETCQQYNVITDGELTDDDLQTIYKDIKNNDSSYLYYTIYFYSDKADVATVNSYATIDDEVSTDIVHE